MSIKKGDFIEIDYVGRLQGDGKIFDLTSEAVAKKEGLYHDHQQYGPQIICVGEGGVVKGLDAFLIGKQMGTHTLSLTPDDAFGKKNAKLIKIIPISAFKKQQMRPFPGLQVNIDGYMGIIKTVSGGRVIVDFNHPLASKDLIYEIEIISVVTDLNKKIKSTLDLIQKDAKFTLNENNLVININLDAKQHNQLKEEIKKRIPEIKEIKFEKHLLKNE
jgi:FKBP-type peptidyl-prolyl cis-trans isomerase SlyD